VRQFSALLSIIGVAVAIAAAGMLSKNEVLDKYVSLTIIAAALAAIAAGTKLFEARRVERNRANRQVFLIYARPDMQLARRVADHLSEIGFEPWLDMMSLQPGEEWQAGITKALRESVCRRCDRLTQHNKVSANTRRIADGCTRS
jgi:hypothetical protein